MPETEDRLHDKFDVRRTDGTDKPNAKYFVMDYVNDPSARIALATYAAACQHHLPGLSRDLRRALDETDTLPTWI